MIRICIPGFHDNDTGGPRWGDAQIIDDGKPTLKEGMKSAAIGAALEGGVAFCTAIAQKRKSGKNLSEFSEEDWKEIGLETGKSTIKGGVRGGTVYAQICN